jgi:hypothetical protein
MIIDERIMPERGVLAAPGAVGSAGVALTDS